jgi:galactan 5-O-arabinofuranosyltransferase
VFSDRTDLYAFYAYYGFVESDFSYSHPTAEFENRLAFLRTLANASPSEFADLNWPYGSAQTRLTFARDVLDPAYFDMTQMGEYVVAVRRPSAGN